MDIADLTATYSGRNILVTGHTGFKGTWFSVILDKLGSHVVGYSLPKPNFSFYERVSTNLSIDDQRGDIRDELRLKNVIDKSKPDLIFHFAAQSLVSVGISNPILTFETNVMGTALLLRIASEANIPVMAVSSDKCYRPNPKPRKVGDPLGGIDPYSASKAAMEMICMSAHGQANAIVGVARAGNAIGGGDWGPNRLIPDFYRAIRNKETLVLRAPDALRPWQHVLEALWGYLILGSHLLKGKSVGPWNFGPERSLRVNEVMALMDRFGPKPSIERLNNPHKENMALRLDCKRTHACLGWRNKLTVNEAVNLTAKAYIALEDPLCNGTAIIQNQIVEYAEKWSGYASNQ